MIQAKKEHSSFRDRDGFVFYDGTSVFRAVHHSYSKQYAALIASGLYASLTGAGLLLSHQEVAITELPTLPGDADVTEIFKVLEVERIPYISYPYEWCFQQLKDAALLTLRLQLKALEHGMSLKDASAFNVQFLNGKPMFIDTLSFEVYEEGKPWVAYRQFCTHFLAPLAIRSQVNSDLHRINELFIDGIPLSIASALLPFKTRFSPFFQLHIHYHAKLESKYADDRDANQKVKYKLSKTKLVAIINHLMSGIESLRLSITKSEWSDYYKSFSYSDAAIENKKELVRSWTALIAPNITWDLGSNTGMFSELVQPLSQQIVAFDIDHLAIEKFYHTLKEKKYNNVLPLVLDINNPTPAIGWANQERKSFIERGSADLVLALALIHHLSIGNNVPFIQIAELLSKLTNWLIIEFVPKEDEQSQRLLVTRQDIFHDYTQGNFEIAFQQYFFIEKRQELIGTMRTLYLMKTK